MEDLRVPKRRVVVDFQLAAAPSLRRMTVFLGDFAQSHQGRERLSDVLNSPIDFIPAFDEARDQMVFIARAAICFARVAADEEPGDLAAEHTIPTEQEVALELAHGSRVEGLISYVLPADRSRITDFLNTAPEFFRVLEKGAVALVSKRHLLEVAPLSS